MVISGQDSAAEASWKLNDMDRIWDGHITRHKGLHAYLFM